MGAERLLGRRRARRDVVRARCAKSASHDRHDDERSCRRRAHHRARHRADPGRGMARSPPVDARRAAPADVLAGEGARAERAVPPCRPWSDTHRRLVAAMRRSSSLTVLWRCRNVPPVGRVLDHRGLDLLPCRPDASRGHGRGLSRCSRCSPRARRAVDPAASRRFTAGEPTRQAGGSRAGQGHSYLPIVAAERNARSSPLMTRVLPVTVSVALDRMSLELLPAVTSTGPGSMTNSPVRPV